MADLNAHNIQVYQLPTDDEDTADVNQQMNGQFPFAVVASNELTVANGRTQRCRTYPWGTVFVIIHFLVPFRFYLHRTLI